MAQVIRVTNRMTGSPVLVNIDNVVAIYRSVDGKGASINFVGGDNALQTNETLEAIEQLLGGDRPKHLSR